MSAAVPIALLVVAAPAAAEKRIIATPINQYATPSVTMDQGEPLFFRNFDASNHDVVARAAGPDGKPIFSTPLIGPGAESAVAGAQSLSAGTYQFFCSVHSNMAGTLTVTTAGTPAPQPGSGGASGSQPPTGDSSPPSVALRILDRRAAQVRRAGKLRVSVQVSEPARVTLDATIRRSGRSVTIARGTRDFPAAGSATVTLELTRAGSKALTPRSTITVTGTATDRAGNAAPAGSRAGLQAIAR